MLHCIFARDDLMPVVSVPDRDKCSSYGFCRRVPSGVMNAEFAKLLRYLIRRQDLFRQSKVFTDYFSLFMHGRR